MLEFLEETEMSRVGGEMGSDLVASEVKVSDQFKMGTLGPQVDVLTLEHDSQGGELAV